ncbi:hypothetical protein PQ43W_50 [Ralstonia phage PQ43W]
MFVRLEPDMTAVVVGCRLPCGLILPMPDGSTVVLKGRNDPAAQDNHGFTTIDSAVWATIQSTYAGAPWLANNDVFERVDQPTALTQAAADQNVNDGFDPTLGDQTAI